MFRDFENLIVWTTLVPAVIIVFYKAIEHALKWYKIRQIFHNAPGPTDFHWFYGNLHLFLPSKDGESNEYNYECCKRFKRYYRVWMGFFKPALILFHPETVKVLWKTTEPKNRSYGGGYRFMFPWIGDGILLANGDIWTRSRRLLTPAFHGAVLKPYIKIYNTSADRMLETVSEYAETRTSFDICKYAGHFALEALLRSTLMHDADCQSDVNLHPFLVAVKEMANTVVERSRNILLHPDFIFNLTPSGRMFYRHADYAHSFAENIIAQRRKTMETTDQTSKQHLNFLDILLTAKDENGNKLSDLEIRNEVDTLLFEGQDTLTSAIPWIFHCLAKNPQCQEKAQAEIDDLLEGRNDDVIEWNDLQKFEYVTMCIKETLRVFTPVPGIARCISKEMVIDGTTYPPGTVVGASIHLLHHNPHVWEKPYIYNPERFSRENVAKMDPYQFAPFSSGPRNCIGQNYAFNIMKVIVARFLRRKYELYQGKEIRALKIAKLDETSKPEKPQMLKHTQNFTIKPDGSHLVVRHVAAATRAKHGIKLFVEERRECNQKNHI